MGQQTDDRDGSLRALRNLGPYVNAILERAERQAEHEARTEAEMEAARQERIAEADRYITGLLRSAGHAPNGQG